MRNIHEQTQTDRSAVAFLIFLIVATIGLALLSGFLPYQAPCRVMPESEMSRTAALNSCSQVNILTSEPNPFASANYLHERQTVVISLKNVVAAGLLVAAAPVIGIAAFGIFKRYSMRRRFLRPSFMNRRQLQTTLTLYYRHAVNTLGTGPVRTFRTIISSLAGPVVFWTQNNLHAVNTVCETIFLILITHLHLPPRKQQVGLVAQQDHLLFPY